MNITMSILFDALSPTLPCNKNRDRFADAPLHAPLLYADGALSPDFVYVATASALQERDLNGMSLICLGTPPFDIRKTPMDLIVIEAEGLELTALFNRVQTIFFQLLTWDHRMELMAQEERDFRKLLQEARLELPFSLIFLNKYFSPVCGDNVESAYITEVLGSAEQGNLDYPALLESVMEDMVSIGIPTTFSCKNGSAKGFYYNSYFNNDYRGKLLAVSTRTNALTAGEKQLFSAICNNVQRFFAHYSSTNMSSPAYVMIKSAINSLLRRDDKLSRVEIIKALRDSQWNPNDRYCLYFAPFDEQGLLSTRANYLITLFENRWASLAPRSCRGVLLENGIAWVTNETRLEGANQSALLRFVQEIMKTYHTTASASVVFDDFFSLHARYLQALHALRFGLRKKAEETLHRFSDYSLDYMLESSVGEFDMHDVIHPGLLALMKADSENHSELAKTLRVYMKCQYNVLQASSELFIHRSTFSVRLKRIEAISGIDLNDERCRLHLLLSFHVLDSQTETALPSLS